MPRLWNETIEAHRRDVREAVLDATAALVDRHGLLAVTMSGIAEESGIGRATLYKYFPDVEAILFAWHERQIAGHLERLGALRAGEGGAGRRLEAVLAAYARIAHESHRHQNTDLAAALHGHGHVSQAGHALRTMVGDLLAEAAVAGEVRSDVAPDELAGYCIHALAGARHLSSQAAVRRLVLVTMAGLRPPPKPGRGSS